MRASSAPLCCTERWPAINTPRLHSSQSVGCLLCTATSGRFGAQALNMGATAVSTCGCRSCCRTNCCGCFDGEERER